METNTKQTAPKPQQPIRSESDAPTKVKVWNVLVRHSPFLLKQAEVEADTPEEAKKAFLQLVRERHDLQVTRQKGPNREKDQERVRSAYTSGMARLHELGWLIRSAEEAKAEREAIKEQRAKLWGTVVSKQG